MRRIVMSTFRIVGMVVLIFVALIGMYIYDSRFGENEVEDNETIASSLLVDFQDRSLRYDEEMYQGLIQDDIIKQQVMPTSGEEWERASSRDRFVQYAFYYGPKFYFEREMEEAGRGWSESEEAKRVIVVKMEEAGFDDDFMLKFLEYWRWCEFQSRADGYIIDVLNMGR